MIRSNKFMVFALILAGLICLSGFCSAYAESSGKGGKSIYVPADYKTIKEALENSEKGDKIYIAAGKYEETILVLKTDMEIYGEGAAGTKIILGGGGIIVADNNKIKDITFNLGSGQIYMGSMDNVTLQGCVISGNGGPNKGILIEKGEKVNVINCTIVNFGTGIFIRYAPCDVLITNCIISNNRIFGVLVSNDKDEQLYFDSIKGVPTQPKKKGGGEIKVTSEYNDVWGSKHPYYGISAGEHDISKAPKFVSESDYRLQSGSPCIDAGDPDVMYNDPDSSRNDMGALPYGVQKE